MGISWFDLGGVTLAVHGDHGSTTVFEFLLKPRQLSTPLKFGKTVTITVLAPSTQTRHFGDPINQSQLPCGQTLTIFRLDHRGVVARVGDKLTMELLADGSAIISGVGADDSDSASLQDLLILALDHAVTAADQSFIHAACLAMPDRRGAVLMHAESGTGKTTTSFAMTLEGYRIISDDAAVVSCIDENSAPTAWGVPRAPKVHSNTVAALPFLTRYYDSAASDSAGEQFLDRQSLIDTDIFIDHGSLPINAMVSLSRDTSLPPSFTKVGPFDALSDMLADNMSSIGSSLLPTHEKRLTAYSYIVRRCACFRANMNGTPTEMARMISEGLSAHS